MKFFYYTVIITCSAFFSCQSTANDSLDLNKATDSLELFAKDFISTDLYERDMAISPSGNEIIYTLGNHKQSIRSLVSIKNTNNGQWGTKQILSFSGTHNDIEPFFSLDGKTLFFASNRPIHDTLKTKDYNIWMVEKIGQEWGVPRILNANINTDKDEFFPSVSRNGNLYFTTTKRTGIGREDIYKSEFKDGEYQPAVVLDSTVNSKFFEFNAYVSPEEDLIIFSSFGRSDGLGGGDLYYSRKNEQGFWSEAKNLGHKVNSKYLDYCPFIDQTNNVLYYTSDRIETSPERIRSVEELINASRFIDNGMGNIYRINLNALDLN